MGVAKWLRRQDVALEIEGSIPFAHPIYAIRCGLPVFAFRLDCLTEIVEEGVSGVLIPDRDPAAFADAVVSAASAPGLFEVMGRHGLEIARQRFDIRDRAAEIGEYVAGIIEDGRVRSLPIALSRVLSPL